MREMKDSGVEWIGEIDKEFNVAPLKFFLEKGKDSIKTGPFGSQLSGSDFLSEPSDYWVYNQRSVIDNNFRDGLAFISQEKFESMIGFQVSSNDILITTRGTIGKINRIPEKFNKGIIHPCIIKFRINEELINYKLLRYIFNESDFISRQIHYKSNATTIDVIYSDTLKNILIPICDLKRQNIICTKLETICLKIDTLIANQQSQIEKLKSYKQSLITEVVTKGLDKNAPMKDSGIEWIGEIPEHWNVIRKLSFVSAENISYGIVKLYEPDENGIKVIRCSDVLEGYISTENIRTVSKSVSDEYSRTILEGSEVIVNVRGTLGGCAVVPYELKGYNIAREVAKIKLKKFYHNRFLMYYFLSNAFIDYRTRYLSGSVYIGLNIELLSSCPILLCDMEEQIAICDYLDNKCSQIDSLISLKQQKIEKLQQYKKSLIYEYVTGKKEVK